jgi:hypothetical protein
MAKKQTRRSISVSRTTYERLKSFCEANNISMSQFVEARVGESLGSEGAGAATLIPGISPGSAGSHRASLALPGRSIGATGSASTPGVSGTSTTFSSGGSVSPIRSETRPSSPAIPMTSAAARFAVEPPPPVIKRRDEEQAPKPAEKRADQIFTF